MPAKVVELHERARAGIVKGATLVAEAARVTLGPKGRNVLIEKSFGAPLVTKDGVTVVKEIELDDRFENIGAKMIREVAQKTNDVAGDGTTTATLLARAIIREGIKLLAAGIPAMELKRGIDAAVIAAVEAVDAVISFDEETPIELIRRLKPDVLVKGGDWPGDQIVGREEVEAAGGRVVSIPVVPGYSTTEILRKIREGAPASRVEA